mmetsp:Transcript_7054/g.9195  ORF Transcript_7054/g.9195 Transcript_7054/m.9195 type:complete len:154 (-) Transcript_7054:1300-1761(-)
MGDVKQSKVSRDSLGFHDKAFDREKVGQLCIQYLDSTTRYKYARVVKCKQWEQQNDIKLGRCLEKWTKIEKLKEEIYVKKLELEKLKLQNQFNRELQKLNDSGVEELKNLVKESTASLSHVSTAMGKSSSMLKLKGCDEAIASQIYDELCSEL